MKFVEHFPIKICVLTFRPKQRWLPLSVPGLAERARLLARHQAVLAQHQVQAVERRQFRVQQLASERADAGEAIVRHHVQAAQGRRRSHRPGNNYIFFNA
jgi:hypothetical protein